MTNFLHLGDLPDDLDLGKVVAIDSETMGLNPHRDRLCVVQLSSGDGNAHLVKFDGEDYSAPNLKKLLADPSVLKLFHFGRFDIAVMDKYLGVRCAPVYCTKIASKLIRTYTDRHGLKDLLRELVGVEISKQQQSSDWGPPSLPRNRSIMRRPMCCICTRPRKSLIVVWPVKAVPNWPRPVLTSCRPVRRLICRVGKKPIFLPINHCG